MCESNLCRGFFFPFIMIPTHSFFLVLITSFTLLFILWFRNTKILCQNCAVRVFVSCKRSLKGELWGRVDEGRNWGIWEWKKEKGEREGGWERSGKSVVVVFGSRKITFNIQPELMIFCILFLWLVSVKWMSCLLTREMDKICRPWLTLSLFRSFY